MMMKHTDFGWSSVVIFSALILLAICATVSALWKLFYCSGTYAPSDYKKWYDEEDQRTLIAELRAAALARQASARIGEK